MSAPERRIQEGLERASLYRLLKLEPPALLAEPVSLGAAHAQTDGAMRRAA